MKSLKSLCSRKVVAKVSPYQFDPLSWRMVVVLVIWMPQNSFALTPVVRQGFLKKTYHVVFRKKS